jgi:hypothetical protein
MGGARQRFYSAVPQHPGMEPGVGGSIGTRYPDAQTAFRALCDFDRKFPPFLAPYGSRLLPLRGVGISHWDAIGAYRTANGIVGGKRFVCHV